MVPPEEAGGAASSQDKGPIRELHCSGPRKEPKYSERLPYFVIVFAWPQLGISYVNSARDLEKKKNEKGKDSAMIDSLTV